MKLTAESKIVDYKGIPCIIPADHTYLTVDQDGLLNSFSSKPRTLVTCWGVDLGRQCPIADLDIEGADWEESLIEVGL